MQAVDFWIPYNFFSLAPLIYSRYSASRTHTNRLNYSSAQTTIRLPACVCPNLKKCCLLLSFISPSLSDSLPLSSKHADGKMKMYRWAARFQSGCCVNMASGKEECEKHRCTRGIPAIAFGLPLRHSRTRHPAQAEPCEAGGKRH